MSGQWEQYVEKACEAGWNALLPREWMTEDGIIPMPPWSEAPEYLKDDSRFSLLASLAAVGPLIEEDTRTRMVEAAAAAVKREGVGSERKKVAEEIALVMEAWRARHEEAQEQAEAQGRPTIGYIALAVECQMAANEARKIGGLS